MKENIFNSIKTESDLNAQSIVGLFTSDFSTLDQDDMDLHRDDVDINVQDETGKTLLHYAAERGLYNTVSRLLSKGANTEIVDSEGNTPLLSFVRSNSNVEIMRALIAAGANPLYEDKHGFNSFFLSVYLGKEALIVYFLSTLKMNINQKHPITNETALHRAVWENDGAIVKLLLSYGADKKLVDGKGRTPQQLAKKQGKNEMVEILKDKDATPIGVDPFLLFSQSGGGKPTSSHSNYDPNESAKSRKQKFFESIEQTNDIKSSDIIVDKNYPVTNSISLKFNKVLKKDYLLSLLVNEEKVSMMVLSEKGAKELISCCVSPQELISKLKTKGATSTQIAEIIESNLNLDLKPN